MKRLLSIMMAMTFLMSTNVFAMEQITDFNESNVLIEEKEDEATIEKVFYIAADGSLTEMSITDYENLLMTYQDAPTDTSVVDTKGNSGRILNEYNYYKYIESSSSVAKGTAQRGNYVYNAGSTENTMTASISMTTSYSVTGNLNVNQFNAVKAGASFGFVSSKSNTDSQSIKLQPKEYGWIEIVPLYNVSNGSLKYYKWDNSLISSTSVTYKSPASNSLFVMKTSKTQPF